MFSRYLEWIEETKSNLDFFKWMENLYFPARNKIFPKFTDESFINTLESTYKLYVHETGEESFEIHPPFTTLQIKKGNKEIYATPISVITKSEQLDNISSSSEDEMQINKMHKVSIVKPFYKKTTPVDLQIEEKKDYVQFNGEVITEWNIDGKSEYQIKTVIKQMLIYSSAAKIKGNNDRQIA